jgi:WD40 repeat protein
LSDGAEVKSWQSQGVRDGSFGPAVAFSPDSNVVAVAEGGQLEVWNIKNDQRIARPECFPSISSVKELRFSSDGSILLAALEHQTLSLEWQQCRKLASLGRTFDLAHTVIARRGQDERIVTSLGFQSIRTGSVLTPVWQSTEHLDDIVMSYDGARIASADGQEVSVYSTAQDPQSSIDHAIESTSRCLSTDQRRRFFLDDAPPRWCITGPGLEHEPNSTKWKPRWPYQGPEWRNWLLAANAAFVAGRLPPQLPPNPLTTSD